jgi:dihydroxyacid dehydratase/phosphogluconate dehydratase
MGYHRSDYAGKPVIAIINTWSDINPCHTHFKQRVEEVKRGVWQAGGFPVEMPAISSEPTEADHHALPQPAGDGDRGAARAPTRPTAAC